jgi:SAM-dependent methyltransferase
LTPVSANRYRFIHLDIKNERYNPGGTIEADDVRFPVPDDWATLVILTSVFTHLYPDAIRRYMREIGRALPPNGAAYVTAFMMDDSFLAGTGPVSPEVSLPYTLRGYCRYGSAEDPLHRIAYDQRWLTWVAEDAGLRLDVSQLGTWRRNNEGKGTQDALVLTPLAVAEPADTPESTAAEPAQESTGDDSGSVA